MLGTGIGLGFNKYKSRDFTPANLANLVAWYRADDVLLGVGADISQWNDKSGNNYHTTAPANSPTLTVSKVAVNNKPVIQFTSANVEYLRHNTSSIFGTGTNAIVIGATDSITDAGSTILDSATHNGALFYKKQVQFEPGMWRTTGSIGATEAIPATGPHMLEAVYNATSSVRIDNITSETGTIGVPAAPTGITIGARGGGSNTWDGYMAEIIILSTEVTGEERASLINYFNERYNLSIPLWQFYFDEAAAGGGDGSYAAPWNSTLQIEAATLLEGTNVLMSGVIDKGPASYFNWTNKTNWKGTREYPVTFTSNPYDPWVIIRSASFFEGNWTDIGGDIYTTSYPGAIGTTNGGWVIARRTSDKVVFLLKEMPGRPVDYPTEWLAGEGLWYRTGYPDNLIYYKPTSTLADPNTDLVYNSHGSSSILLDGTSNVTIDGLEVLNSHTGNGNIRLGSAEGITLRNIDCYLGKLTCTDGDDIKVEDSTFHNHFLPIDYQSAGGSFTDMIVRRCRIYAGDVEQKMTGVAGDHHLFGMRGTVVKGTTTGLLVEYCMVYSINGEGVAVYHHGHTEWDSVEISNCYVYDCFTGSFTSGGFEYGGDEEDQIISFVSNGSTTTVSTEYSHNYINGRQVVIYDVDLTTGVQNINGTYTVANSAYKSFDIEYDSSSSTYTNGECNAPQDNCSIHDCVSRDCSGTHPSSGAGAGYRLKIYENSSNGTLTDIYNNYAYDNIVGIYVRDRGGDADSNTCFNNITNIEVYTEEGTLNGHIYAGTGNYRGWQPAPTEYGQWFSYDAASSDPQDNDSTYTSSAVAAQIAADAKVAEIEALVPSAGRQVIVVT